MTDLVYQCTDRTTGRRYENLLSTTDSTKCGTAISSFNTYKGNVRTLLATRNEFDHGLGIPFLNGRDNILLIDNSVLDSVGNDTLGPA